MMNKIMKFLGVTLFSFSVLFLLGSLPFSQVNSKSAENKEFTKINNSAKSILPDDFDSVMQKNPAILLEITVE